MDMEPRLVKRYHQLVKSHMKQNNLLSPGIKQTLSSSSAFSQTQAAWRFFNNERCELKELIKPLIESAHQQVVSSCKDYGLVAHDWSGLSYRGHVSKADRLGIHNEEELGYELQSSLLLSDKTGSPLAPLSVNVLTDSHLLSSYRQETSEVPSHLEELSERIKHIESAGYEKPLVHIIDREGDSAQFLREITGSYWLIRSRSNSRVSHEGKEIRVDRLAKTLSYDYKREISYKGRKANQLLAMTEVSMTRASKPKRPVLGKRVRLPGGGVHCRLVVSKTEDMHGKVLAWWYLLTNVTDTDMGTIALWYYWRWSIESFFKLLKSAGMHVEQWQQTSGKAIARRLLIACMACVFVWQLAQAQGAKAGELRELLVRLSGRQMKYGIKFTRPALFAGLCSLLTTLELLEQYDVDELKQHLYNCIDRGDLT